MHNKKSMSTAGRQLLGFGAVILLFLAMCAVSAYGMQRLGRMADAVHGERLMPVRTLGEIGMLMMRNRVLVMDMMANPARDNVEKRSSELEQNVEKITQAWKAFSATDLTPDERRLADDFQKARGAYVTQGILPANAAMKAGDPEGAKRAYAEISRLAPAATASLKKLMDHEVRLAEEEHVAGERLIATLNWLLGGLSIAAITVATAIALLLTRSLVRALGAEPAALAQVAERIAGGDLSPVDARAAAHGSVMASMQAMQQSLAKVVREVRVSVDSVATASAQIAAGNQDLSSRTEQQASSLQQTAASMEQMTGSVRTNADSAREADQLARGAAQVAEKGGTAVSDAVTTMAGIQSASRRIAEIIGVIDGIAFQTNILALNAAVEAARAGEQGRGFAVVAAEVRNLAQRAAQAAREIKALIADSVQRVDDGSARVQAAGSTIAEVVAQVNRLSRLIGEITAASQEQSGGIEQVGSAVAQLDKVTQQNAALVEQSAAAAGALSEQADKLAKAVAVFRLGHGDASDAAPASARARRGAALVLAQ